MATPICCCYIWSIQENTVGLVERLGAYERALQAGGPHYITPCVEEVPHIVSLKQKQVTVQVTTKVDKAELTLVVKVQYKVINDEKAIPDSKYLLATPVDQIRSFVQDALRSAVSTLAVEKVFDAKDEIGKVVFDQLSEQMKKFGYEILHTLVTDVEPSAAVKDSYNLTNLNRYRKESDSYTQLIKTSQKNTVSAAQKTRDQVLGMGISLQRQEIVNGLKSSVDKFTKDVSGVSPRDVLELVLITQYFDMLKDIGEAGESNIVLTPGNEGAAGSLRDAILQGNKA